MVRLWDVEDGKEIAKFSGPPLYLSRVIFSPDGKTLAAIGGEETDVSWRVVVYLWDVPTWGEIVVIKTHARGTEGIILSFSPDSRTLAYAADDSSTTVRLWDIAAGIEKPGFSGNFENVDSLSFSPDGKTLVTAYDHGVRLWDVATRTPKVSIRANNPNIAIFSPDGGTLVTFAPGDRMFWLNVPTSGSAERGNAPRRRRERRWRRQHPRPRRCCRGARWSGSGARAHPGATHGGIDSGRGGAVDRGGAVREPDGPDVATRHSVSALSLGDVDSPRNGASSRTIRTRLIRRRGCLIGWRRRAT